jgi:hemolysin III
LGIEWTLALLGIILYATNRTFFKKAELLVYIFMGWAILPGGVLLARILPPISMILLFVGGIVYTLGTIWYSKPHIRGNHVTWHAFVLAGAACHWISIWFI